MRNDETEEVCDDIDNLARFIGAGTMSQVDRFRDYGLD